MARTAELYRMAMEEHLCPYGLKSKDLLSRRGFDVEDHKLTSREGDRGLQARAWRRYDTPSFH